MDTSTGIDRAAIMADPAAWIAREESTVAAIVAGTEKEIVWAYAESRARTPVASALAGLDARSRRDPGEPALQVLELRVEGEANDSVGKSMSGGRIVLRPETGARFVPHEQVILGNCALYGATGGELYAHGRAGDRFAVRNSGAHSVVEGVGLHACEYMTGGRVLILGELGANAGAGMTGGELFARASEASKVDRDYLVECELDAQARSRVRALLEAHADTTGSALARELLDAGDSALEAFRRFIPRRRAQAEADGQVRESA